VKKARSATPFNKMRGEKKGKPFEKPNLSDESLEKGGTPT